MGEIQKLEECHIPAVASLYLKVFRKRSGAAGSDLQGYFREVFLQNPWRDDSIASLVYSHKGKIVGFVGVIPRSMTFHGRPIRVAVVTQLMADTDTTVKGLAQSSTEATEAMASAAKILGDPSIPETLKHTDATSANIEAATGHLNETTALIEGKVKKMTAPASLAKQAAEAVAHYATLFWGAFLGAK